MCDREIVLRCLKTLAPALTVAAITIASLAANTYVQYVVSLCLVAAIVGGSLVLIVGLTRVIMLASGAVMAVGAYLSTILLQQYGMPYPASVLAAGAAGAFVGLIVGIPASRFRGHQLAMATLVFQFVIIIGLREWSSVTGGAAGLHVPPVEIFGHRFATDRDYLALIGAVTALVVAVLGVIVTGQFGKVLRAITATEVGAEAFGINVTGFRLAAFVISSMVIAGAGALLAPRVRILDPASFGFESSILMLAYPIVGGMGSIWGGILGGGILRALPELLRGGAEYQDLIYAALVILVMTFFPGGFVGALARAFAVRPAPAPTMRLSPAALARPPSVEPPPRADSAAPALEIVGLAANFGALRAVDDVSLRVDAGVIHGLIGPNGAGKTTLFNIVSGFVTPAGGTVRLFGRDVIGEPPRRRLRSGMTRTFQQVCLFAPLSCVDNVILGLGRTSIRRTLCASVEETFGSAAYRRRKEAALAALDAVGLVHRAQDSVLSLSLGDQRRLEVARAIASNPRLVLLDEPVSGVSHEEQAKILALLRRINAERAISMFVIEHNIHFIRQLCTRLSVMASGRILADGSPEIVIRDAAVRKIYFGESWQAT